MTIAPTALRALLQRGKLTGSAAGRIAGVNSRTIRRWIGGESAIPFSAYRVLEAHVDQAEMIAEAIADHTAWTAAMDADTADRSNFATREQNIWMLTGLQQMQRAALAALESDTAAARAALEETTQRLNELKAAA